jgi:type III secretion protein R
MEGSQLVLFLTVLGALPILFMGLTAFVKISTVLFITRSAIGMPSVPSNVVVLVLSAALTVLAMMPVGRLVAERATPLLEPSIEQPLDQRAKAVLEEVREPLRKFYAANASARETERFTSLARAQGNAQVSPSDFSVVIPAFLVTELLEAFALGFAIFLPFLVIDLLVSNVLVSLGVSALSPAQIALPLKLLLFVSLDGWGLLAQSLIKSYAVG